MPDRSLIAVVVPAYNLARFLPEALESALAQTLPPESLDVLVVDDGSTDETADVAASFAPRVRYVHQENRGLPAARNRGAAETTAPYLTFLDADDRLLPDKLARELALLQSDPSVHVIYSGWHYVDEAGRRLPQRGWSRNRGDVLERLLAGNIIHPHAATLRRSTFEAAGGFDETLTSVEDWDLWLRVSLDGARWAAVDEAALEYRVRGDGMHANPARMLSNRLRVLEKTFERIGTERPELLLRRPTAFANAYLEAACDWARAGDFGEAGAMLRAATRHAPELLTDARRLRDLCRLLLPLGHRNDAAVGVRWPEIEPMLRRLVTAAQPRPGLLPRLRSEMTLLRVALRYRRKRLMAADQPEGA